jgi:UDP-N-acetylglucosamine transferase subunit ALG13
VIFLTIGTHEPFDRLVQAMDAWCEGAGRGQAVFGQIAEPQEGGYRPRNFDWVSRLAPADYAARFAGADLIVSHAGMGSIITALQNSKPIVVMPRRGHLRETRNDHQHATVRMLGGRPGIHVAEDETHLAAVIGQALAAAGGPAGLRLPEHADHAFTDRLRAFLLGRKENME